MKIFKEEMKKTHKILVPSMLPTHLSLVMEIFKNKGYDLEFLETSGPEIINTGLANVHNDTCYPAILVIGQLIEAIESGRYDKNTTALMITQTGGGCRASNYINILRKALVQKGLEEIPVISLSFSGVEESGIELDGKSWIQIAYCILLGDLIMMCYNQVKPYEIQKEESDRVREALKERIIEYLKGKETLNYFKIRKLAEEIVKEFHKIPKTTETKPKVGIVGEIYVKFSPLGNNKLEEFLLEEGAEPVLPPLWDFCIYALYNSIEDYKLYGKDKDKAQKAQFIYRFMELLQKDFMKIVKTNSSFRIPVNFSHMKSEASKVIGLGVKMGEGWLLPGEMLALVDEGVNNIIITQPFGCLPNHIVGKGMIRKIKEIHPKANIVSIDYDPGSSRVNQENRIKLMLASAQK